MYALLRSTFAAADDSGRGEEITDQVSLCFQIVRVQPDGDLEFAMSLVSQRNGGKGAESIGLFGLAAIGFPEPVVIIGAFWFERDGAFQAGDRAVIVAKLIKAAAQPIVQRRFLRLALNRPVERFRCLAIQPSVIKPLDIGGQFVHRGSRNPRS